ncbi:MAG: hypothetical protein U5R30_12780 [Deltaproteobacteria bacterium]|nr:hypothetical protein [Deltaproteobacteria bacterium]
MPLADGLDIDDHHRSRPSRSATPRRKYTAFIEKAHSLRSTEYEVLVRLRSLATGAKGKVMANFIEFGFKTPTGILEAVNTPAQIRAGGQGRTPKTFLDQYDRIIALLEAVRNVDTRTPDAVAPEMRRAMKFHKDPSKKGKVQLDPVPRSRTEPGTRRWGSSSASAPTM